MVLHWWIKLNGNVVKLVSVITIGDLRKPHTVGYDTNQGRIPRLDFGCRKTERRIKEG